MRRLLLALALPGLLLVASPTPAAGSQTTLPPVGTVVGHSRLLEGLWVPSATRAAYKLKYVTTDAHGRRAYSTGELFLPWGKMPRGGFPVISWAHGTSGLGDTCAPSKIGPALPQRWRRLVTARVPLRSRISAISGGCSPSPAGQPRRRECRW